MKIKRIISLILLILIGLIIFFFSNENGETSSNTSDAFTSGIINIYEDITQNEITSENREEIIIKSRFTIRKTAHFTLYFAFGILMYIFLSTFNIKHKILYAILFSMLFASTDEFHQLFINGRTAQIVDVLIDSIGSIIGIILVSLIHFIKYQLKIRHKA